MTKASKILQLFEAIDLSKFDKHKASVWALLGEPYPKLQTIIDKDDLVIAVHGTYEYWALWFCLYGVDTTVEPPTKTLGRGNMQSGFSKIKTKGLFVSADKTSGFMTQVFFQVKPSELGMSLEMLELGHKKGQELYALIAGDCLIIKPIPAKRILKIRHNNKEYTRQEFIKLFPNPYDFIDQNANDKMYSHTPLKRKQMINYLYRYFKKRIEAGKLDQVIKGIKDSIKHSDFETWDVTKRDVEDMLKWAENKG